MNSNLFVSGNLIKYSDGKVKRIVIVDATYNNALLIELYNKKVLFEKITTIELESLFYSGEIEFETSESFDSRILNKISIVQQKKMEKQYEIVCKLLDDINTIEGYLKPKRTQIILLANEYSCSKSSIYNYYRTFLQGGQTKMCLLPLYNNCGGLNKRKKMTIDKPGRRYSFLQDKQFGVVRTKELESIFDVALKKYYLSKTGISFEKTYQLMLKDYFTYDSVNEYGEIKKQIRPLSEIPSKRQLYNWWKVNYSDLERYKAVKGIRSFKNNVSPLISDSNYEVTGPGHRFQIDATPTDYALCDSLTRENSIGKATLYFVTDVYSRAIVGIYVGLDNPSWDCAALAIYNAIENKVEYCNKYGINIDNGEWPMMGLPKILLADRGEILGVAGENMIENLGISIENARSYKGSDKGIVEQLFHMLNCDLDIGIPGKIKKDSSKRGVRNPHKDAMLDIYQFTRIIIKFVLIHNKRIMDNYHDTKEMIEMGVELTPLQVWNYGMKNKTGFLRSITSTTLLKQALLRKDIGKITAEGIVFKNIKYVVEDLDWLYQEMSLARINGVKNVDIYYDKRHSKTINLLVSGNLKEAFINERKTSNEKFNELTWDEVDLLNKLKKQNKFFNQDSHNQNDLEINSFIQEEIKKAKKLKRKGNTKINNKYEFRKEECKKLIKTNRIMNEKIRNIDKNLSNDNYKGEDNCPISNVNNISKSMAEYILNIRINDNYEI